MRANRQLWLKVPNDETIPDMNEIVEFALKLKNDPSHVRDLRELAENYMTWEMQYKKVFDKIEGEE